MSFSDVSVLIDIDGCVLPNFGDVNQGYYEALCAVSRHVMKGNEDLGPKIRLCSGRDQGYLKAAAKLIGLPNSFSIAENGVLFLNPATRETVINPQVSWRIRKLFEKRIHRWVPKILRAYPCLSLNLGNMLCLNFERKHESQLDIEQIREGIRKMLRKWVLRKRILITSTANSINVVPREINKGTAVAELSKRERIRLDQSIGIGDSKQDIPFLRQMRFVGCPNNATDICKAFVKSKRGRVSLYQYSQGVVDILEFFGLK